MSENILDKHGTEQKMPSSEILTKLEAVSLEANDGYENSRYSNDSTKACVDEVDVRYSSDSTEACVDEGAVRYSSDSTEACVDEGAVRYSSDSTETCVDEGAVRYGSDSTEQCIDEGDGFMKIVGTLMCGVNKNKLLGEDKAPYPQTREPKNKQDIRNRKTDVGHLCPNRINVHNTTTCDQRQCKAGVIVANATNSDLYDFTHRHRGYVVLVVNDSFFRQSPRDGASLDLRKMKEVAEKFRFRSLNNGHEKNLSKSKTMDVLWKAQKTDHSDCDCFMFMISTHGLQQRNAGKGGTVDHALVCANDQLIFTSTIVDMFNDTNCPTLKGKPKIFFIQACRGTEVDHGSDVSIVNSDNKPMSNAEPDHLTRKRRDERDTNAGSDSWVKTPADAVHETISLKCHRDMLVMFAIPPGMLAWRSTSDGSWMIHYIHEVLMAYDRNVPKNLLKLLTNVAARMSRRLTVAPMMKGLHEKMAVPVIEHRLIKDILF